MENYKHIYKNKIEGGFLELIDNKNWVAHNNKKIPFCTESKNASTTDPNTWLHFEDAIELSKKKDFTGIGYVIEKGSDLVFIDIDHCVDISTGEIEPVAKKIIDSLNSYTEISPSGTGVHIIMKGEITKNLKPSKKVKGWKIEFYNDKRYFTVTFNHLNGTPNIFNRNDLSLKKLYEKFIGDDIEAKVGTDSAIVPTNYELLGIKYSDEEIINKLSYAKNCDKFKRLFYEDFTPFGKYTSQSEAVSGLIFLIAFYTKDKNQIDRIFKRSKLYSGKWTQKWEREKDKISNKAFTIVPSSENLSSQNSDTKKNKLNDLDLTNIFLSSFGRDNILFHRSKFWLWFNDLGLWKDVDDRFVANKLIEVVKNKIDNVSNGKIKSVLELCKTECFVNDNPFDANSNIINCRNGKLEFINGSFAFQSHDKSDYCTSQIPINYDHNAKAERYEKFKTEIFISDIDSKEKGLLLDEIIGYSLLKSAFLETFFILIGNGANGKSVFLNVVRNLLGIENVSSVCPKQLSNRFQRAYLSGKLANIVTEIAEGEVLPDAELKAIVSGESITAENKGVDPFDFQPYSTLIFATNHLPHTRDISDAMQRRAIIVNFNRTFKNTEIDTDLCTKLNSEIPGIFNFALQGLLRLLNNKKFTRVLSSENAKKEWILEADQISLYIDECCSLDPTFSESNDFLYQNYRNWAVSSGVKNIYNKNNFLKKLSSRPQISKTRSSQCRGIKGLKVVNFT